MDRFPGLARAIRIDEFKEFSIPMKRSFTVVCTLASMMAVGFALPAFSAQTGASSPSGSQAGPSKIAVIGFEQAVLATNEGRRTFASIQAKFQPKETALKSENSQIDALKKELQDKGSTLTDADRNARLKTIDEKTKTLQREAEDDQNDMNSQMQDAYSTLAPKVGAVLDSYAKQQGYTLVLDGTPRQNSQSPILWFGQGTDITKAVIDAYNAKSGVPAPAATAAPAHTAPRSAPRTGARPKPQ